MLFLWILAALPVFAQVESVKVHAGDNLHWADPAFDDSSWMPRDDSIGTWSWARYKVRVPKRTLDPVIGVESATMEVYVEGRLIGRHGKFPPAFEDSRRGYSTFVLPPDLAVPGSVITVGLRMWDPPGSRFRPVRRNPPVLLIHPKGETPIYELRSLASFRGYVWSAASALVVLLLVSVAGRTQQRGREFALALASWSAFAVYELVLVACYLLPWSRGAYLATAFTGVFLVVTPLEFIALAIKLKPPSWMRIGQGFFAFGQFALLAANAHYDAPAWTSIAGYLFLVAGFVPLLLAIGLLVRRNTTDNPTRVLLLLLTLSLAGSGCARLVNARECPFQFAVSGVELPVNTLGFTLFGVALAGVMLARFRKAGDLASQLRAQMDAARSVQEMLLTAKNSASPGYAITTEYRPADEVGGDFFLILSAPCDATLVVVGDVSGKGLRAAMLVSVIVGALLNRRSDDPAEVLAELNSALAGQLSGGFVTCCAALLEPSGRVKIASAGHLAPYCGGGELDVPTGLPLGVSCEGSYETATFHLSSADQLALLSDGVVEAANSQGELFGFERTQRVSNRSAREIADAATAWGQNDDITVVIVRPQIIPSDSGRFVAQLPLNPA
jgi:phosphoserine phosphatase RsbU/P